VIAPVEPAEPIMPRTKEHPMNRKNLSRRFAKLILPVGLAIGISSVSAETVSAQGIIVKAPFSFSAGKQQFPAGTYQFTQASEWMLSIRNVDGGGEKFFPVTPGEKGPLGSNGRVLFFNTEEGKVLQTVYVPGTDRTAELAGYKTASLKKTKSHMATSATSTSAETVALTAQSAIAK
jgi:hypothetical protein